MERNNLLVSGGVAALMVVLGLVFFGRFFVRNNIPLPNNKYGAIPGNSVDGTRWCVGGRCSISYRQSMTSATSTECVSPAMEATSTIESFTAQITQGTTTDALAILSTSTTAYAPPLGLASTSAGIITAAIMPTGAPTSSQLFAFRPVPDLAGTGAYGNPANPTSTASQVILSPGERIIFHNKGGGVVNDNASGTVWRGTCTALFQEL